MARAQCPLGWHGEAFLLELPGSAWPRRDQRRGVSEEMVAMRGMATRHIFGRCCPHRWLRWAWEMAVVLGESGARWTDPGLPHCNLCVARVLLWSPCANGGHGRRRGMVGFGGVDDRKGVAPTMAKLCGLVCTVLAMPQRGGAMVVWSVV